MANHQRTAVYLCAALLAGSVMTGSLVEIPSVTAHAAAPQKAPADFKWTKKMIPDGTNINASDLWPEETDPSFTAVYRDGEEITRPLVAITEGHVYHFRGVSEGAVLYTEVYPGVELTTEEAETWYRLLPSEIREQFEESGWTWRIERDLMERASLDRDAHLIRIRKDDSSAILYGFGLYLDDNGAYLEDPVFTEEEEKLATVTGSTDNLFASALECYYTKGGELKAKCPDIYGMISEVLSHADLPERPKVQGPVLVKELLDYANAKREEAGLSAIAWDVADDDNIRTRAKEITTAFSQTRPDGSDAFSAYTDDVQCEIRLENVDTKEELFENGSSYFLSSKVRSFNCAVYKDVAVLIFVW